MRDFAGDPADSKAAFSFSEKYFIAFDLERSPAVARRFSKWLCKYIPSAAPPSTNPFNNIVFWVANWIGLMPRNLLTSGRPQWTTNIEPAKPNTARSHILYSNTQSNPPAR